MNASVARNDTVVRRAVRQTSPSSRAVRDVLLSQHALVAVLAQILAGTNSGRCWVGERHLAQQNKVLFIGDENETNLLASDGHRL